MNKHHNKLTSVMQPTREVFYNNSMQVCPISSVITTQITQLVILKTYVFKCGIKKVIMFAQGHFIFLLVFEFVC